MNANSLFETKQTNTPLPTVKLQTLDFTGWRASAIAPHSTQNVLLTLQAAAEPVFNA
jgi:hypothetical protein